MEPGAAALPPRGELPEGLEQRVSLFGAIPVQSLSDAQARLYYRWYVGIRVGDKYFCVVVKVVGNDAFVLTAYLTDTIKKGQHLWPAET